MRARLSAFLLAAIMVVAGCGEPDDTTVIIGTTATPADGVRTPTPVRSATPTADLATPVATETAIVATATVVGATPNTTTTARATSVATATAGATPVPTPTPSGPIDADVQHIAADILPFLANIDLLTGGSVDALSAAREALKTDACPGGGSRIDDEKFPARTLTFQECAVSDQLGAFAFDGTVVITLANFDSGTIAFDFTVTDQGSSRSVHFVGTLALSVESSGFVLNGPQTVTSPEGTFTLTADDVAITAQRKLVSGKGQVTDDADTFTLQSVGFVVTRRGAASNLTATFDDGGVHTYTVGSPGTELEFAL